MSIIFNRIESQAKSIALTYTQIMKRGNADYDLEQEKLKNVLIEFSRSIRLEAIATILRELYDNDMNALSVDMTKVEFSGGDNNFPLENRGKVLMHLNPALKSNLGTKYYAQLVRDIHNKVSLEEYADILFPEVF